ncbi:hypothetical protein OTU49_004163, partial [Cherax quadricarinatus]
RPTLTLGGNRKRVLSCPLSSATRRSVRSTTHLNSTSVSMKIWHSYLIYTSVALLTGGTESIQVEEPPGLKVFENGTVNDIVLDCPFVLEEGDSAGLVIKWFHLTNPVAVYQWIPSGSAPQATGILEGRVDLEYQVSQDNYHRHRALRILQPTTELTGQYTCSISSFNDEKLYKQNLIIYSEPQEVKVWTEQRDEQEVTVVCEVNHVFPQPRLYLLQVSPAAESVVLSDGKKVITQSQGTYNLLMERTMSDHDLAGATVFQCVVTIPDTQVQVIAATKYHPTKTGGSAAHSAVSVVAGIALLVLWRV